MSFGNSFNTLSTPVIDPAKGQGVKGSHVGLKQSYCVFNSYIPNIAHGADCTIISEHHTFSIAR